MIHELIGLHAKVVRAKSAAYLGIEGVVADETKNTLVMRTPRGARRVPKSACAFRFDVDDGRVDVDGAMIAHAPEDRPKVLVKYVKVKV
jgi:ribonuclease P protein subunit POP4